MRILFIYPNKVMVTRVPSGIGYLSAHLKKEGHQVELFDTTFIKYGDVESDEEFREKSLQVKNPELDKYGLVKRESNLFYELDKKIQGFNPDIIAVSVVDPNYKLGLEILRYSKEKYKNILRIMGGIVPTVSPEEVINEDCVDMICIGEGEDAFCELCKRLENRQNIEDLKNFWIKKDNKIYKNPIRNVKDINEILPPDLSIFDERHFIRPLGGKVYKMGTVMWTRGCVFRCKYCANSVFEKIYKEKGKFYRIKDTKLLIKELEDAKEKYKFEFFFFVDDLFPLHEPKIIEEFCKLYKEKINLPFSINLQPTLVREEELKKVIDVGCVNVCIGLESGSNKIRREILGRDYKNENVIKAFNFARKNKIRSSSFNMIGLPHETREDIFETIELNKQANPTSATVTFFHPYRGLELRDLCLREKLFNPAEENVYRGESCLSSPLISRQELSGIFKTFQLYLKLPKDYYDLIKIAEGDTEIAKEVYSKILKPKFDEVTKDEAIWDFSRKKDR
ncbi:B12-binding domain-containing radical SAM protein [Candidatus Pacearchaeota archaeon]|nr:B12-binding domain-containing radical SAM protein [Candidatus Pacearchaeota archaeon]